MWARITSNTWLTYIDLGVYDGTDWTTVRFPALTLNTWTELTLPLHTLQMWGADLANITHLAFYMGFDSVNPYTGTLYLRDWRIGTMADAKDTPGGDLVNGSSYDWRVRYHDDADVAATTTLAADPAAGATNLKVTSTTGITVGDTIVVGSATVPYEAREVTVVGTAGSGGTGITFADPLAWDHANGETLVVRYFGGWSPWVTATYRPPPTITLTGPTDAGTVTDPTPTVSWTLTDGSGVQAAALVKVYRRTGTSDGLIWQGSVTGTTNTLTLPTLLLTDGETYAWEVTGTDTYGVSDTSDTRWTFTADFTAPAAVAGVAGLTDAAASAVDISWFPSTDTYLDHYRVYWLGADGEWVRLDGGPEAVDDGNPKLVSYSTGAELVSNGTFTTNLTGWTAADGTSSTWQAALGPDGTGCLRTIGDGTGTELVSTTASIAVVAGRRYRFSASLYGTAESQAQATVVWQDGSYATLKTEAALTNVAVSTWESKMGVYVAPAGAAYARLELAIVDASTSEVRFDNVSLREVVGLRHYGARWGQNDYKVMAHNGSQPSEPAYGVVTLTEPREGWWQVVVPDDGSLTYLLRVTRADRSQAPIVERHDPPGRGATVHIGWGRGPFTVQADVLLRPSEDGALATRMALLMRRGHEAWLKAPPGWGWDPIYCVLTDVQERPQTGGLLALGLTFERTDDT